VKVLITGVAGFIGSRLADYLRGRDNVSLFGVDDLSAGYASNVPQGVEWQRLQLGTGDGALARFWNDVGGFDLVYHLAAYAAEGLSPFIREFNYRNNVVATAEVVNCCLRTPGTRLVFASSMAVYGDAPAPFSESQPLQPIDPYGVAKLACELDIRIAGDQHDLPWTIVRPHNVYGMGQSLWQRYRNVLGIWMREILEHAASECWHLPVFGDGSQTRAFSCIEDLLPQLWAAGTHDSWLGRAVNLGSDRVYSIREAAETLLQVADRPHWHLQHHPARHEATHAHCRHDLARELLFGTLPETPLDDGIAEMWDWAQREWTLRRACRREARIPIEVENGLYPQWRNPA
jgi:UDP-glucose 4-epimerase